MSQVRDMCRSVGEMHAEGRLADAAKLAAAALELCQTSLGKGHYAWPLTLCASAACHAALGESRRAVTELEEAVERARSLESSDFEHARTALTHAAELFAELGHHKEARQIWHDLIQLTGQELGIDHPRYFAARERFDSAEGEAQTPSKRRT